MRYPRENEKTVNSPGNETARELGWQSVSVVATYGGGYIDTQTSCLPPAGYGPTAPPADYGPTAPPADYGPTTPPVDYGPTTPPC